MALPAQRIGVKGARARCLSLRSWKNLNPFNHGYRTEAFCLLYVLRIVI